MPSHAVHCEECVRKLGKPYEYVHSWLDEFAPQYHGSKIHRKIRHNENGVRQVAEMWGPNAAQAAIIHIQRDRSEDVPDMIRNMSLFRNRRR
jgi:hypothetical protein